MMLDSQRFFGIPGFILLNTLLINEMLDSKHFFGIDRLDYSSYTLLIKECLISKQFFGISSLFCSSEKLLKLLTCRISGRWLC